MQEDDWSVSEVLKLITGSNVESYFGDCMYIVLGRFQPFHKGHEHLINHALDLGPTVIAIGSSQAEMSMDNPWNADEREAMIRGWLGDRQAKVVKIPDINDPPNWVEHAKKFHGEGILVTSDASTKQLYEESDLKFIGLSWKIENHMRDGESELP